MPARSIRTSSVRVRSARNKAAVAVPDTGHDIDLGFLADAVGFYLRTAHEAAFRAFLKRVEDSNTPPWRMAILVLIDANPGLTQVALARATRRDTSSLTPALDDLCERGLVTRIRQVNDRRSYALKLTPAGKRAMRQLKASAEAHERELDRLVGREQRAQFIQTLKRLASGLSVDD
ncbi:MAG: MarR family winged helix-turn-helix transcriptional regulator [Pseudomonadota bacterium]